MKNRLLLLVMSLFLMSGVAQSQNIGLGNLDDFNDDTVQGWTHGGASVIPPIAVPGGGPDGSTYLENTSLGGLGPDSRHLIRNADPRWTGDYIAAGVNKIRVNIINFGVDPLPIRVATVSPTPTEGGNVDCWVSTEAQSVPGFDGSWRNYEFLLDETTMTQVGSSSFEDTLRNVSEIRILAAEGPACAGDPIAAISGYDDIQSTADMDLDGINDTADNCTLAVNPRQCIEDPTIGNQVDCETGGFTWGQPDTDGDLYGNHCDGDIAPQPGPFPSGDCSVNFLDLQAVKAAFLAPIGTPSYNPDADLVYDGIVNFSDLQVMKSQFLGAPGPGLGNCGCAPDVASDQGNNTDFVGLQMFLRGGLVLDWVAVDGINNFVDLGAGNYQARVQLTPGNYGYKIADFDWNIDYANEVDTTTPGGPAVTLNGRCGNEGFCAPGAVDEGQGNSPIEITEAGCYQFDLVAGPPDEDEPFEADTADVTVTGPLP